MYVKADEPFFESNLFNLHYMPWHLTEIAYNGKAKTSVYFEEIPEYDEGKGLHFSFNSKFNIKNLFEVFLYQPGVLFFRILLFMVEK